MKYIYKSRGQAHSPIESRYYSDFFCFTVQVLLPSRGQEFVPLAAEIVQ